MEHAIRAKKKQGCEQPLCIDLMNIVVLAPKYTKNISPTHRTTSYGRPERSSIHVNKGHSTTGTLDTGAET